MTVNPFADPDTAAADVSGDFLTNEELIGRHVIIVPKTLETIKAEPGSTWPDGKEKKDYAMITTDIVVLDGRGNPKIKAFPHLERGKHVTAFKIIAELKKYVGTGTPVLGYWTKVGNGFFLEPAEPKVQNDPATRQAWERYQAAESQSAVAAQQPPAPPF